MSTHIEKLKEAVEMMHECRAEHRETIRVFETCGEEEVWGGVVEAFALFGHPKAKFCYAWSFEDNHGEPHYMAFLEVPARHVPHIAPLPQLVSNADGSLAPIWMSGTSS